METVQDALPEEKEGGPTATPLPPGAKDHFVFKALGRLQEKLDEADPTTVSEEDFEYYRGKATAFCNLSSMTLPPKWDMSNFAGSITWLESFMTPEGLQQLVTADDVGMDDPRIRPFTEDELQQVRAFFFLPFFFLFFWVEC